MENRQVAIIATLITALLCGCPGLLGLCFGSTMVFAGFVPSSGANSGSQSGQQAVLITGIAISCLGVLLVAMSAAVGYFTLRRKPLSSEVVIDMNEPIPPPL